jgi:uncharacterized cupredoxin-like copper-binding protein
MIRRALPILVLAAAMVAGGVLAVGASGHSAHAAKAKKLAFKAKTNALRYTKSHYTVRAGTFRVTMTNPSGASFPHSLEITRSGKETKTPKLAPGKHASFTIRLKKGTYKFYCTVDGHHAAGMKGTITVK